MADSAQQPLLDEEAAAAEAAVSVTFLDIFKNFFLMGWVAFGGPTAHIGFFQKVRRQLRPGYDDGMGARCSIGWAVEALRRQAAAACSRAPGAARPSGVPSGQG